MACTATTISSAKMHEFKRLRPILLSSFVSHGIDSLSIVCYIFTCRNDDIRVRLNSLVQVYKKIKDCVLDDGLEALD